MPRVEPRRPARRASVALVGSQRRRPPSGARRCRRGDRSSPPSFRRPPSGLGRMKSPTDAARKSLSALQGGGGGDPARSAGEGAVGLGQRSGIRTPPPPPPPAPPPAGARGRARRLVVKIGSALLADEEGEIHRAWLDALVDDLARCRGRGQDVIVVSSGAIAVGPRLLGVGGRPLRLEEKQAAAATGQIRLAHAYQEALARHRITVAQILLTLEDT